MHCNDGQNAHPTSLGVCDDRIEKLILSFFLISAVSCASAQPETNKAINLKNGVVVWRSDLPPYSGYTRTWVVFKIKYDELDLEVLYPYFSEEQKMPEVGQTCDMTYVTKKATGLAGQNFIEMASANIVLDFECRQTVAKN
jgi:hypothetical protein